MPAAAVGLGVLVAAEKPAPTRNNAVERAEVAAKADMVEVEATEAAAVVVPVEVPSVCF